MTQAAVSTLSINVDVERSIVLEVSREFYRHWR